MTNKPTEAELRKLYLNDLCSLNTIAKMYGVQSRMAALWVRQLDIPIRSRFEQHIIWLAKHYKKTVVLDNSEVIDSEQLQISTNLPEGTEGLGLSLSPQAIVPLQADDEEEVDSAYMRLPYKQQQAVIIWTDLDPEAVKITNEELARRFSVSPETVKQWRRDPGVIQAISDIEKPESASRLGQAYRRSLAKRFYEGKDTDVDRKLAADLSGDSQGGNITNVVNVQFNGKDY